MRLYRICAGMIVVAAILGVAESALCAHEQPIETVQPIETEEGIWVCTVTIVTYYGSTLPGESIWFVDNESCFPTQTGEYINRNVANLFGIKTRTDDSHLHYDKLISDTMRVFLDFTDFDPDAKTRCGFSADAVAAATLECVLLAASKDRSGYNPAKQERTTVKFLDVRILGSEKYQSWEKVYSFEKDLADLPRTKVFQD